MAAAAVNNLQVDPERSVLLALHALEEADTLEARNALHQAIPELHILFTIPAHPGGVPDVAYSPDGKLLASLGPYGEIKVWAPGSGNLLQTLDTGGDELGSSLAFSPDGNTLAAALQTRVILWDVQRWEVKSTLSGQSIGANFGYNLGVGQTSFSPDSKRLAAANMDGVSKGMGNRSGRVKFLSLEWGEMPAKAIAYSPDGKLLAAAGDDGNRVGLGCQPAERDIFTLCLGGSYS